MRRLIVTIITTLDCYAAGEGGDVFAMPIDLGFDRYNLRPEVPRNRSLGIVG